MSHSASKQLDAIHSMLTAGQRNLRVERHSLILWGISCGALFLLSQEILTPEQIPDNTLRALAWLALLTGVLMTAAIIDWRLTRQVKESRDESWSFIHRQVIKVWWLLMAMGILLTFAVFFYGGGYIICAAWLVLLGVGLYVHGLFSEELLEWVGGTTILIGIACLAAGLSYPTMTWIAASVFGIGLPLLSMMLDRGRHRPHPQRFTQTLFWLVLVLAPPVLAERLQGEPMPPDTPVLTLEEFRQGNTPSGFVAVTLPAGSAIPVEVEVGGTLFSATPKPVLTLTLAEPVQLLLKDGELTGDARRPGERWTSSRATRWISIPWIRGELTPETGPLARSQLIVRFQNDPPIDHHK